MIELGTHDNSPLCYPGSKARRALRLLRLADQSRKHYVEPFAGGLGILFRARKERLFRTYAANDIDPRVVNFWTVVRDNCDLLVQRLQKLCHGRNAFDKDFVLEMKEQQRTGDELTRAVAFLALSKLTLRGGGYGGLTTPSNRHAINPTLLARLPAFSDLLQGVVLTNEDYRQVHIDRNSFTFFDPPYERAGRTLYKHRVDLTEFRDWTSELRCSWLATLNDSSFTNDLFKDFDRVVEPVQYLSVVNGAANSPSRRSATEIVVMNYQRSTRDVFVRRFGWKLRKASRSSRRAASSEKRRSAG